MVFILRTESHIINKNHYLFKYCDDICFKSKNLYNYANYLMRKDFFDNKICPSAFGYNKLLKEDDVFRQLPAKTSQQIIINLVQSWKNYFKSIKVWKGNKNDYTGKPKLPNFKKKGGRNIVMFDYQQVRIKNGKFRFPKTELYMETNVSREDFRQIQIIPFGSCYKIAVIYRKYLKQKKLNNNILAIDLGIDNLATLTSNTRIKPVVINGKVIKSVNQFYNKKLAKLRSYIGVGTSNKIQKLNLKRNNKIDTHFHRISRWIINYCVAYDISTIIIGRNKDWQRHANIGRVNNQKFVQIPFEKLIYQLTYKAEDVGISVIVIEESYTSKASFIDNDEMIKGTKFSGKRIKRGLYQSKNGTLINADVNGSYNILRKCNAQFSYESIEGVSLHPIRLTV